MKQSPYRKFENENLILRDELAIDRTVLANERTLLAYLRAGVALFIAGVTILQFVRERWFLALGVASISVGLITNIIGIVRYLKMNKTISLIRKKSALKTKESDRPQP